MLLLLEGKISFILSFSLEVQSEKVASEFPKTFDGYLFVFVEYFSNRCLKMKTNILKTIFSTLATLNYRNWQDASPPLTLLYTGYLTNAFYTGGW